MGSDFRDPAVLDHGDPVGHAHGGKAMGDQQRHLARGEFLEVAEDLVLRLGVL